MHARHLVDLVKRWGVTAKDLGVTEDNLDDVNARMAISQVERIVTRAIELTGEPGLGFYLALEMRISWHGFLGFAAMTAPTLREALALAEKFMPTRTTSLELRLVVNHDTACLFLDEKEPLGAAREVIVVGLLFGLGRIGDALTGRELTGGHAELALARPPHFARFAHLFKDEVRFDRPAHCLVFPASLLDVPLTLADASALKLATARCEEELRALGFDRRASARVKALLSSSSTWPSADEAARALGMSARTLKRRLADDGTTYSDIVEEARRQRARLLLRDESLSIAEIADQLGYADAASFTHAYKRWTGTSPTASRRH